MVITFPYKGHFDSGLNKKNRMYVALQYLTMLCNGTGITCLMQPTHNMISQRYVQVTTLCTLSCRNIAGMLVYNIATT